MKSKAWLLLALALALFSGACGSSPITQDQELIDLQVYQPETVYVGVITPAGGDDRETRAALETAADIINNTHELDWDMASTAGIIGYGRATVELVWQESGPAPAAVSAATQKLLDLGVSAVLGGYDATFTAAAATRAAELGLPLLSGSATGDWLTDGVTYDFQGWFCRVSPSVAMESEILFSYLKHLNQTTNAGLEQVGIAYENTNYGRAALEAFNASAESYGFQVVARISYSDSAGSVAEEVQRMISNEPDVIVNAGDVEQLLLFLDAYADSLYLPQLLFCYGDAFQDIQTARLCRELELDYVTGVVCTPQLYEEPEPEGDKVDIGSGSVATVNPNPTTNTAEAGQPAADGGEAASEMAKELFAYINDMYRQRLGWDMDDGALMDFASLIVLAQAIGSQGCTDPQLLLTRLHSAEFAAPYLNSGSILFDQYGQNTVMCGYMAYLRDGHYISAL